MNTHPFLSDDLLVSWSTLTPEHVEADLNCAIELAKAELAKISAESYETSFAALENASKPLERAWGRLMHLESVCGNDEAQRAAIGQMMPVVVEFFSSITLDPKLWAILQEAAQAPWVSELSETQKRFINETILDFKENGAMLSEDQKPIYAEIETKLAMATKQFTDNVLDSTNAWELIISDPAELEGLPESVRETARQDALSKGLGSDDAPQWRFTQQHTSMGPVLQFAESDKLRKAIWLGANTIGMGKYDNAALISEILDLRAKKAQMLGFSTFADLSTARRMARTGDNALAFINSLHEKVRHGYVEDMESLRLYKEEKTGSACPVLAPWEVGFWSEKRRRELYNFDEEALRPYYSVQHVMDGLFSIYSKLFGITVQQRPTSFRPRGSQEALPEGSVEVWHPETLFFEIYDAESKEHLGSFYADWHPRDSKRAGAWMNGLHTGLPPMNGKPRTPHLGLMVGNMSKPIGGKPALLNHREVETIFHEFGHLLHLMLSNVEVRSLAGTNVAWDFVELPSQIMENWCWEREAVDLYAKHYETGERIPEELFAKMRAARNYMSATDFMRQLTFGKIDLELHQRFAQYAGRDLEEIDREILADYRVPMLELSPSVLRRMTHLFSDPGGYAAGYYSYKWAEVLEADAFSRFLKEGVLNPITGKSFRENILSKGNSHPAAELYRNFMGRDPDPQALLIKLDIHD